MEFHISRAIRDRLDLNDLLFSFSGNVVFGNVSASRRLAQRLNTIDGRELDPRRTVHAAALFAMGLIDELSHALIASYRKEMDPAVLSEAIRWFTAQVSQPEMERLLLVFAQEFPNLAVYRDELTAAEWLKGTTEGMTNREAAFEEMLLLWLANGNPAFKPFRLLFDDKELKTQTAYGNVTAAFPEFFVTRPTTPGLGTLLDALRAPMLASPDSLTGQLEFIREKWTPYLGDLGRVLLAIDVLREEEIAVWMRFNPAGPGQFRGMDGNGQEGFEGDEYLGFESEYVTGADGIRRRRYAAGYQAPLNEYEAFSADQAWMPTVVLIAKNTYVWLEQLSKKYGRHIHRLDQIPDEELHLLSLRGITGLWLIGLWERSRASKTIKRLRGNSDAVASAYSLKDYRIADDLGGEQAYENLRHRAAQAGLRLASDMVPNHMGIDSDWVVEHPEWFLSRWESPFPSYSFNGPDLSTDSRVEIKLEDHYYDQTDAAVVFQLRHHGQGNTRYIYHGNDGTTFAWNDTAQLDYSKADVREHVIQVILAVARRFPIIRFDAAMVLAKRHVQRLWFPLPGAGGSIPSRAENAISEEAFEALMPMEFWREVVDRVAAEVPGTLLLAEAFWLLEGYFVRTLGMHRVYNSAFMNMLRDEENAKYRSYLKKTVEFDPDILKRYVNFMSNPDERTAIDQFGSGDKYFGVCVLLATLPGLPMFGHGQIEAFGERYGMDFKQAMYDELPNEGLIARHQHQIAPLLKSRHIFAESTYFVLYDFWTNHGTVDENVFAYSNRSGDQRAVILYNNSYDSTSGTIHNSVGFLDKASGALQQRSLAEGLALPGDDSVVIAYRDTIQGLEFLRRGRALRDEGLTLPLRGYQHVVLLHWRELWSSRNEPWDRLCDFLNGAGVPSVNDAMTELRVRPLFEAARNTITEASIEAFSRLSTGRSTVSPSAAASKSAASVQVPPKAVAPAGHAPLDLQLSEFVEQAHHFAHAAVELAGVEVAKGKVAVESASSSSAIPDKKPEPSSVKHDACSQLVSASLRLPTLLAAFPSEMSTAARKVLPGETPNRSNRHIWAPIVAWLAVQALPAGIAPLSVYDTTNMRKALADTFSSLGFENEAAWRAAAKVRVLLKLTEKGSPATRLGDEQFWSDPDVRWLAGYHGEFEREYFDREQFEELLCWLQLPAFMDTAGSASSSADCLSAALELSQIGPKTSYKVRALLQMLDSRTPRAKPGLSFAAPSEIKR